MPTFSWQDDHDVTKVDTRMTDRSLFATIAAEVVLVVVSSALAVIMQFWHENAQSKASSHAAIHRPHELRREMTVTTGSYQSRQRQS